MTDLARECMVGEFSYQVAQDAWRWSEQVYTIFGFLPGEVVPTTELISAHVHPGDAERVRETFTQVLANGGPYSCYCRIFDARRRVRHVVMVGDGEISNEGEVTQLLGYLVDMTRARRRDAVAEADAAVRAVVQHRAAIEQAKGALMFVYGIDADTAFAVLAAVSQQRNIKVNRLAEDLMATPSAGSPFPVASHRLTTLLGRDPMSG